MPSSTIDCPYLGIVDTVKEVVDAMDGELRGNPLFASVEEMGQVERGRAGEPMI